MNIVLTLATNQTWQEVVERIRTIEGIEIVSFKIDCRECETYGPDLCRKHATRKVK